MYDLQARTHQEERVLGAVALERFPLQDDFLAENAAASRKKRFSGACALGLTGPEPYWQSAKISFHVRSVDVTVVEPGRRCRPVREFFNRAWSAAPAVWRE